MGDLVKLPYSKVSSILELLDRIGVLPSGFEALRVSSERAKKIVARVMNTDPFLWAMLNTEDDFRQAGFMEADFAKLVENGDALRQFLATMRETKPTPGWREENGVIYLTVTLDKPTFGDEWILRTEEKGNRVGYYAKSVLRSESFNPSVAGTYEIVILKGSTFIDRCRVTKNIRDRAKKMNLQTPMAYIACLIRETFSDKEIEAMGLWWIVTMHEPIVSGGDPRLLTADRGDGGRWLRACLGYPGSRWNREFGFAFLAPQVP